MHLGGDGPRQPSMLLTCTTRPGSESWAPLPTFATRPAEIAIFRLSVAGSRPFAPHATAVLQAEELRRAQRYHRAVDYYRFLLGRAALRLVLGAYAELPPASLHFEPGVTKKPLLREAPGLHYNVSHAGDWVVLAVSEVEVGIDVERLDPLFAFQDVLDHSFSPAEKAFVERSSLPHQAFYQLWTRKEAFVKATGRGIDAEFSQMPALMGQHQVAGFCQVPRWVVSSFEVAAGYAAAIAYPAASTSLLRFYDLGHEALCALYEAAGCCFTTA